MLDEAIGGSVSVSLTAGNVTLSTASGSTDQARNALIVLTGTPGTTRTVTFPNVEKLTHVFNNSNATATLGAGGGTTVSLLTGEKILVYSDGATNMAALSLQHKTGAFNPVLAFGAASVGITYAFQDGLYTKIGNRVFFEISIELTNKGSSTGAATITAMPFAPAVSAYFHVRQSLVNLDVAGGYYAVSGTIGAAGTIITLNEIGDNIASAALTDADFQNTSELKIQGHYSV